jgi:hypothetical protein
LSYNSNITTATAGFRLSTILLILITAVLSACSGPMVSSPVVYRTTTTSVHLAGRIDDSSYEMLEEVLTPGDTVTLDSGGGLVSAAGHMAALVMRLHADTRVDQRCVSACALVFAAGHHRTTGPDARIGVHQSTGSAEVDEALGHALRDLGTPAAVVDAMEGAPARALYRGCEPPRLGGGNR